jgi:hypothetical protein
MEKQKMIDFFSSNKLFEDYNYVYDITPQYTEYIDMIANSENQEDFIILLYGLDDNVVLFEFTEVIIDNIGSFYYSENRNKKKFFIILLNNIKIVYPHAMTMIAYVLKPILYNNDLEAKKLLCDSLDTIEVEKLKIFKEIYLRMIEEDSSYKDDCIMSKLGIVS